MILLTFNIIKPHFLFKNLSEVPENSIVDLMKENTKIVMRSLELYQLKATFFVEFSLIKPLESTIKELSKQGHEIALFQGNNNELELADGKKNLDEILQKTSKGLRLKEIKFSATILKKYGFLYVSAIQNSKFSFWLKKNHLVKEDSQEDGIDKISESNVSISKFPLNEFTFQYLPRKFFQNLIFETLKQDGVVLFYLNTWQFSAYKNAPMKLSWYKRYFLGRKMEDRFLDFLQFLDHQNFATTTIKDYLV